MRDWKEVFGGKKITVMGLGLLGRGAGDAEFLAECEAELIVTDLKSKEELAPSLKRLERFPGIAYRLGGHDLADFKDRDYILQAAGIRTDSIYLKEAEKQGIPIKMSASWFAELSGIPIVGVTGTRGKSTVTHLIYQILRQAGVPALLGGNVRGISTLALLSHIEEGSVGVFELDSWQCHGFGKEKLSPQVAVFTTLYPDHMNYYRSEEEYLDDKAQIFLHQHAGDTLILGMPVVDTVLNAYGPRIKSHITVANPAHFPDGWHIRIPGAHNLLNAVCAIEAARALKVDDAHTKSALEAFEALPGRLEFMGTVKGVGIYNDNNSTTPEATVAALHAIPGSDIVLIMGGNDKGLDMSELASLLPAYTKKVILLKGTGTDRFRTTCSDVVGDCVIHDTLEDALGDAIDSAQPGDSILFSPAFASFGMFNNEFERGDLFTKLVRGLPS